MLFKTMIVLLQERPNSIPNLVKTISSSDDRVCEKVRLQWT